MRHIKYFNESNDNKEYYQRIDYYSDLEYGKLFSFSDSEIKIIKDKYESLYKIITSFDLKQIAFDSKSYRELELFKGSDEWYYVILNSSITYSKESEWYKCDQWDGLLKFLTDKVFNHVKNIKLFENKYYTEEYINDGNNYLSIPDNIKKHLDELLIDYSSRYVSSKSAGPYIGYTNYELNTGISNIHIRLLDDEWFMVSLYHITNKLINDLKDYKCDQLEGVIQLLKDKLIIH